MCDEDTTGEETQYLGSVERDDLQREYNRLNSIRAEALLLLEDA